MGIRHCPALRMPQLKGSRAFLFINTFLLLFFSVTCGGFAVFAFRIGGDVCGSLRLFPVSPTSIRLSNLAAKFAQQHS
jgi:hypothetical protein